jgi:hypothetical protein
VLKGPIAGYEPAGMNKWTDRAERISSFVLQNGATNDPKVGYQNGAILIMLIFPNRPASILTIVGIVNFGWFESCFCWYLS